MDDEAKAAPESEAEVLPPQVSETASSVVPAPEPVEAEEPETDAPLASDTLTERDISDEEPITQDQIAAALAADEQGDAPAADPPVVESGPLTARSTGFTNDPDADSEAGPQFSADAFSDDDFAETIITSPQFIRSSSTTNTPDATATTDSAAAEDAATEDSGLTVDTGIPDSVAPAEFVWKSAPEPGSVATPAVSEPTAETRSDGREEPPYHTLYNRNDEGTEDEPGSDDLDADAIDDEFEEVSEEDIVRSLRESIAEDSDGLEPLDPVDAVAAAIPLPERRTNTVDADALQATLRHTPETTPPVEALVAERPEIDMQAPRVRNQFGSGLSLAICIALVLLAAYGLREPITEAIPQAGPALEDYASFVDRTRLGIQGIWSDLRS